MDESDDEPALLNLLAEKITPQPVSNDQLAYCPTMDLVAVGTRDDQVHVFRLNGQRVFGAAYGQESLKIRQLYWKPNGEFCLDIRSQLGDPCSWLTIFQGSYLRLHGVTTSYV